MDKRWIYILIILILGCVCLYFIVDSSTTLGHANTYVGKFTVTLPNGYNVYDDGSDYVIIINRNTNEKITVTNLGKAYDTKKLMGEIRLELNENENISLIRDTEFKCNNVSEPSIYYEMLPDNTANQCLYITVHKHTFLIEAENFKDNATMHRDISSLIDTLKPDPKQKQD